MSVLESLYYIGVDMGATWIKMGIVTRKGQLLARDQSPTDELRSPRHFLSLASDTISRLIGAAGIERDSIGGIGVGAPGWVNYSEGIVRELTNVPGWRDIPLARRLEQAHGLKSFVDNDANVMAVAEMIYGAGRGRDSFVCLTLGTGVGGSIVVNGEVYRGNDGLAGEIGHLILDLNGPPCACGAKGCLERYIGNRYIVENAVERLRAGSGCGSALLEMADNKPENITPALLSDAAAGGDRLAIEVWQQTGRFLGVALAVLVNLLNPECFIIGGGVAKAGKVLLDPARETMGRLAMNRLGESTPVLAAELGEEAGIIGAATFAMRCVERS